MSNASIAARQRMSAPERREQLLDVAASAVLVGAMNQLTMERLAELAGVSKALPYNHFNDIDHVLISLYKREARRLGTYIWDTLDAADPDADLVAVHIGAYFDGIERAGDVFGALTTPGSAVAGRSDPRDEGPRFSSRMLRRFHGVPYERARILGPIVHAAVLGAGNGLRKGIATRTDLEAAAIHMLRHLIDWDGGRA